MNSQNFSHLRSEYLRRRLRKADAGPDPMALFTSWLDEAVAAGVHEPNAMTLATADARGQPSARLVLLKGVDENGFYFYTNYSSRKGRELDENPFACLVFWWAELERQVRVEGGVVRVAAAESDAYYHTRPLGARLGAWASQQSSVIPSREVLEERLTHLQEQYAEQAPERPPFWGGYRLIPHVMEFWQGGEHRLHDRLRYTRLAQGDWHLDRLAP